MNVLYMHVSYCMATLSPCYGRLVSFHDDDDDDDEMSYTALQRKTAQFTQLVWKATREIGVGRAFADHGRASYVVCYYFPAGNCPRSIKENVFPPKK